MSNAYYKFPDSDPHYNTHNTAYNIPAASLTQVSVCRVRGENLIGTDYSYMTLMRWVNQYLSGTMMHSSLTSVVNNIEVRYYPMIDDYEVVSRYNSASSANWMSCLYDFAIVSSNPSSLHGQGDLSYVSRGDTVSQIMPTFRKTNSERPTITVTYPRELTGEELREHQLRVLSRRRRGRV